jgi:hypothetical protein
VTRFGHFWEKRLPVWPDLAIFGKKIASVARFGHFGKKTASVTRFRHFWGEKFCQCGQIWPFLRKKIASVTRFGHFFGKKDCQCGQICPFQKKLPRNLF